LDEVLERQKRINRTVNLFAEIKAARNDRDDGNVKKASAAEKRKKRAK